MGSAYLFSISAGYYEKSFVYCKWCGTKLDLTEVAAKAEELKSLVPVTDSRDTTISELRHTVYKLEGKIEKLEEKNKKLEQTKNDEDAKKKLWKDVLKPVLV